MRIELESCAVGKCPGAASTAHAADRPLPGESWDATDGSLGMCAVRHKYASAFLKPMGTEPAALWKRHHEPADPESR